jgi:hypothetical protein
MSTPSLPQAKGWSGTPERPPSFRSPTPETEGLASPLLGLQRAAGNLAVGRLLQAKLRIGPPGDTYEREADRVAEAVLRGDSRVPISVIGGHAGVQRMCAECEEELLQRKCHCQEEEDLVQPKAEGSAAQPTPGFETQLDSLRGSGRPLPADLRSFFEPRFGHDFGAVRIHTGAGAEEATKAVRARAFTVGNDVVFGSGEWAPETTAGKSLLAHELTHVVQQTPVARRKPLLQRAPEETGEPAPEPETPAPSPDETAPASQSPPAAVIVEDDATGVGEGQMKKSEFLARLRPAVLAAAEAGLSDKSRAEQVDSVLDLWLGRYEEKDAAQLNSDLGKLIPGERPTTAEGYVSAVAGKVRTTVATWESTGEVPAELSELGGESSGIGVFFKAKPGGPRDPGDPRALQARLGAGRPLDGTVRSRMESAFGRGFSHVRVHADSDAASLATSLNAKAFTVGEHVAFGAQEYRPGTLIGDGLIAHELAHVAQQDGATTAAASYEALEQDADLTGASAVASLWNGLRSLRPEPRVRSGLRLQRCGGCNSNKASTIPVAAGPPAACEPTGVDFATLQTEAPFKNTEATLGYTQIDLAGSQLDCTPQFAAGSTPGSCSFTPRPIKLVLISKYVKPGDYPHHKNHTIQVGGCGNVPIWFQITDDIAEQAKKGEQEHCADIKLAVARTLEPCSKALQKAAGTAPMGNSGEQCLADLSQKLGFNPRDCSREFNRLQLTTTKRDIEGWHNFDPYPYESDCQRAVFRWRRAKKNRIGDPSATSEAVIPQATGCSASVASPAASPASPAPPPTAQGGAPVRTTGGSVEEPSPETASEAPEPREEATPTLIVDDDAGVAPGQMKKSAFLARLRPAVHAAAEAGLSDKSRAEPAGSFVDLWLDRYEEKDAAEINGDLGKLVPGERPTTAEGLVSAVAGKVRTGVAAWERTGQVTPELSRLGEESSGIGGLLGGLGGVFFKAKAGGPRDPGDPRALQERLGAGQPLDGSVRSRMESTFGRGFSHVRVHTDSGAAGLATSLNAQAFTVGEHVAFGAREYRPGTVIGDALIAHELAHVVQQDGAIAAGGAEHGALERDADRAAAGAVLSLWGGAQAKPEPRHRSPLRLSRCSRCNSGKSADCRPQVESFDAVKGSDPAMSMWYGKCRLALGTREGNPGMSFAPTGTVPEDCSGELQFLQLIDTCRDRRTPSGEYDRRKYGGYVLDNMDPYGVAPGSPSGRVPPGGPIEMYTNDNPGVDTPGYDQVSADDKFKMWLLWKPDNPPGAPRIPLWMVEWSWRARATRTGHSGDCTSDWTVSGAEAKGGSGKPTSTMPAWSAVSTSFQWEKGSCGETEEKGDR